MAYWVMENIADNYVRPHRGECPTCKAVCGSPSIHGCWHGPFQTYKEALRKATATGRRIGDSCKRCNP